MDLEMEMVRKIMLEQEALFREQVQELHRVYRVQKMLMAKHREVKKAATLAASSRLELASGYTGEDVKHIAPKTESSMSPIVATATTATTTRRRTFDLELPAEEYMDVEMEEPNSKACDLVSKLNGVAPSPPPLPGVTSLPAAAKNLDLSFNQAVHGLESSGCFASDKAQMGRNRDGEAEILQMIKRAKSSDEGFSVDSKQVPCSSAQGFLGGLWAYGLENGTTGAARNAEKGKANGFHLGSLEDKGSKQQHEVLSLNSKPVENQHVVFLDSGMNRLPQQQQQHQVPDGKSGIENFNPFFASTERGVPEENGKYSAFSSSMGGRLQNHVSYSSQGILIPSTNMARRESFLEPGLGLWWRSNSNYYQPQYQQVAVLQTGTPSAAAAAAAQSAVQVAWQGSGFATTSGSYHHGPMLAAAAAAAALPAVVSSPAGYKEENGGTTTTTGWLKGNNGGSPSPAFHYSSASTPPRPPFKKPPKLILDGATMELKLAPLDGRPACSVGSLVTRQQDSVVTVEEAAVTAAAAAAGVAGQSREGCFGDGANKATEISKLELPPLVATGQQGGEKSGVLPGTDLNAPEVDCSDKITEKQEDEPVQTFVVDAAAASRSAEQQSSVVLEERVDDGVVDGEVVQESGFGIAAAAASASMSVAKSSWPEEKITLAEAKLVVDSEQAPSCSCSQPGCSLCGKGSIEDVQMQQQQQRSGKAVESCGARSSEQQPREEISANSKKRRFKLVSSKDLLATRETENDGTKEENGGGDREASRVDNLRDGEVEKEVEVDKKRRKNLMRDHSSKTVKSAKPHSGHHEVKERSSDHSALKVSPGSRHKDRGHNGYSASEAVVENPDDGANLAAEILVSLAPAKLVPAEKNGALRVHHKSKRRLIDTLSTGGVASGHGAHQGLGASKSSADHSAVASVNNNNSNNSSKESSKKKKKKKNGGGKTILAKFQTESLVSEDHHHQPKVSFKSVKVALTQCEYAEGGPEAQKSSSKHKKKLLSKKPHHNPSSRTSSKPGSGSTAAAAAAVAPVPPASGTTTRERDHSSKGTTTTTLNVVISKSSTTTTTRGDGGGHHHHHHHHHYHHHDNNNNINSNNKRNYSSEQEQQQAHHNSSSEDIKESDELDESSCPRRSWGASARRKRMRRSKRSGL